MIKYSGLKNLGLIQFIFKAYLYLNIQLFYPKSSLHPGLISKTPDIF